MIAAIAAWWEWMRQDYGFWSCTLIATGVAMLPTLPTLFLSSYKEGR